MSSDFFKNILAEHDIEPLVPEIESAPVTPQEEFVPPPRIQTPHKENSDPTTFKVGTWEEDRGHWGRMALPKPRYPEPGAVATPEIAAAYDKEWDLQFEARDTLERYLLFVKTNHLRPGFFEVGTDNHEQLANERLAWLRGVWNSRGLRCHEQAEFVAMALEKPPQTQPAEMKE